MKFPRTNFLAASLVLMSHCAAVMAETGTGAQPGNASAALRDRVRIYQFLPRLFGNTDDTRKPGGSLEENGCGKFSDLNHNSLSRIKEMGFTHIWPTGVLQQATATDYSTIGEPADDPDLLKGLAGSPYAIKDYFDVCPDYADDPRQRLSEFRQMVERAHAAGLKVIIDFVPNHVARSYSSTIRPESSFGIKDDPSRFLARDNNFYYLTPDAKPSGEGPPLRLPMTPTPVSGADGLFAPESKHGRVTGNNLVAWEPDKASWYETVKLNYGFDFLDRKTRLYPHENDTGIPLPDTWTKMDEIIAYWQGFGVDGFRADMAHMIPPEFWRWVIGRAKAREPETLFIAEAYENDPAKVPPAERSSPPGGGAGVLSELLAAGFDAVYDDATYDKLKEIYDGGAWANDLDRIGLPGEVFENSLRYAENHDEVRLASPTQWGGVGMDVGRPVSAILFGLSRGPLMLYSGQEVGEPATGAEGFGGNDSRTSIFDYWSMPEFSKWVNGGAFDGGKLSAQQISLRDFYARLLALANEPAFSEGDFLPLNPSNINNPHFGQLAGEKAGGHFLYAFLRHHRPSGQTFLVAVNLHPVRRMENVSIEVPENARGFFPAATKLQDLLSNHPPIAVGDDGRIPIGAMEPLTPYFFKIEKP